MHDLVIRGGTVVDGTGAPARTADVTVDRGHISGVGSFAGEAASRTVDADGLLVTPGWVDIHTHYDGQATWDEVLAPSSWHGVTTVVTGNCGVGFAPARPDRHEWLIGLMEGVEDIPGSALAEGMTLGVGDLPRVPRRAGRAQVDHGRRDPDRPRGGALLRDGRARRPQRAGDTRGHRSHEAGGQGGDRRRRARVLHVADPRPPGHRRGAGARHLRRRGRAVRHRQRPGRARGRGVRAGPGRHRRRGHHQPEEGDGLDAAAVGRHPTARSPSPWSRSTTPPTSGAS